MRLPFPRYGRHGWPVALGLALGLCFTVLFALVVTSCATMKTNVTTENPSDDQKGFRFFQRRF